MGMWFHKTLGVKSEAVVTLAGSGFIAAMGLAGISVLPDNYIVGKIAAAILLFVAGCFFCRGVRLFTGKNR